MDSTFSKTNGKNESAETRDRWPDRPGWDVLAQTVETLAEACGGNARCHKKYEYLSVGLETRDIAEAKVCALRVLVELVEQVSDTEDHGHQSTVHWVRGVLARMPSTAPPILSPADVDDFRLGQSDDLQFRVVEDAFASGDPEAFDRALTHIELVRRMKRNGTLDWQATDDEDTAK
ncbi:MAG: hypothetical protein AAFN63_07200 [Pseudomonadota bacterium]